MGASGIFDLAHDLAAIIDCIGCCNLAPGISI
jgi:hypothetical protein